MNKANKYFKTALLIYIILTLSIFSTIAFRQSIILYVFVIIAIVLALGMLLVVIKAKKEIENFEEEVNRIREREKAQIERSQLKTDESRNVSHIFKIDEALAKIMPSQETQFDDINAFSEKVLQNIAKGMNIVQGLVFVLDETEQMFNISGEYAYYSEERPRSFPLGETISGQVAKNQVALNLKELPDGYVTILSGLGKGAPPHLLIAPIVLEGNSIGVIELASFTAFGENEEALVSRICEMMATRLNDLRNKYE